jgi:hypothetical protein
MQLLPLHRGPAPAAKGGGVQLTLMRPKTTLKRNYFASACIDLEDPDPAGVVMAGAAGAAPGAHVASRGFAEAARDAVRSGVSCAALAVGIHRWWGWYFSHALCLQSKHQLMTAGDQSDTRE